MFMESFGALFKPRQGADALEACLPSLSAAARSASWHSWRSGVLVTGFYFYWPYEPSITIVMEPAINTKKLRYGGFQKKWVQLHGHLPPHSFTNLFEPPSPFPVNPKDVGPK